MSLDTLANVKARLGVSDSADDSLLTLLQDSADQFIASYCDRDFEGGTFTEYHPGGAVFVHLRNYPVASVTSVKVDPSYVFAAETTVPTTSYVVHTDRGVIQSLFGPFWPLFSSGPVNLNRQPWTPGPRVVQVVYATATGQVPADVKEAYARLVGHWHRRVKTESAAGHQDVRQHKFGDTFVIYGPAPGADTPRDVTLLLAPYRAPRL